MKKDKPVSNVPFVIMLAEQTLVTPAEVATAQELMQRVRFLHERVKSFGHETFIQRFKGKQREFYANPSDDLAFNQYSDQILDRESAEKHNTALRTAAKAALKDYYSKEVEPFLATLLERAIPLTQTGADKLRKEEAEISARFRLPYLSPSSTVRAGAQAVAMLKSTLTEVKTQGSPFLIREVLDVLGIERPADEQPATDKRAFVEFVGVPPGDEAFADEQFAERYAAKLERAEVAHAAGDLREAVANLGAAQGR